MGLLIRWATEVWNAANGSGTCSSLSLPTLRGAFSNAESRFAELIDADGRRRFMHAGGPIDAMFLALHRIGCSVDGPFTFVDHSGIRRNLTSTPPAMLAGAMKIAVLRSLEADLGADVADSDPAFDGRRVCVDPIRTYLSSRVHTAAEKASVSKLVCDGVWTRSRAVAEGYDTDIMCDLCGQH